MNKPILFFNLILNNGEEKNFSLYEEQISFDYGIGDSVRTTDENILQASLRIEGKNNLIEIEKFIFNNYKILTNINQIKKVTFEIHRENYPECNQTFNFEKEQFDDLSIYYTNNSFGENRFILSFKIIVPEEIDQNFKGILNNG